MEITIPTLLPWQQSAIDRETRRNLVNAGRQSGKSTLLIEKIYGGIVRHQKMALLLPTYKNLWSHWSKIINIFFGVIEGKNETRMTIDFSGGSSLECFSGESADVMRGNEFDLVLFDEAAHADRLQEIVEAIILPTLLARRGSIWLLSTPKGTTGYFNQCKESGEWTVTEATSYQNTYLDPAEIDRIKSVMSPERILQELEGVPCDENALTPFFYAYSVEQHFRPGVVRNPRAILYFSFDFNVAIMSVVVAQLYNDYRTEVLSLIQLKNSSVEALCERLSELYPADLRSGNFRITGDASGNNRSGYLKGNISFYQLIKQKLRAKDYNLKTPSFNPGHAQSQQLVNAVLHLNVVTIGSPDLNRQMRALSIADAGIVKDGNDHGTDCLRYLLHTIFSDALLKPYKYLPRKKVDALPTKYNGKYTPAY